MLRPVNFFPNPISNPTVPHRINMPSKKSTKANPSRSEGITKPAAYDDSSPLANRNPPRSNVAAAAQAETSNRTASGKRRRKRKARTQVSSSESSSSEGDSDDKSSKSSEESEAEEEPTKKVKLLDDTKTKTDRHVSSEPETSDSSNEDMADVDASSNSSSSDDDDENKNGGDVEPSKKRPSSKPRSTKQTPSSNPASIPPELRTLTTSITEKQFEEYYMKKLTEEFGDDLNSVRQSKDFNDRSLPILVRALKGGVKGFGEEDMRVVIGK